MDDGPLIYQWTLEIDETEYIDGILKKTLRKQSCQTWE